MDNFYSRLTKKVSEFKTALFLIADILLISIAVFLAFYLRFDAKIPQNYSGTIKVIIILALVFCLPIFYFLRLYSFSWSYVSLVELVSLFEATTLAFLFVGVSIYFSQDYYSFQKFPRSTLLISYILVFVFCGGLRLGKRIYSHILRGFGQNFKNQGNGAENQNKKRTLIVGAGDAGEQILRSIHAGKNSDYLPIGFADDNPAKQGVIIHGLKVFGRIDDIARIIKQNNIERMIIALPSAGSDSIRRAVEAGRKAGLADIKTIPPMGEIISGEAQIRNLRKIEVEDLLGRETAFLDTKSIKNFIFGKKVLITGAAGSIGSELSRKVAEFSPSSLLLFDQDETGIFNILGEIRQRFPNLNVKPIVADIRDEKKVKQIFSEFLPNIVLHAAAYKHVPLMEKHPDEAVKNNIFGAKIIANASLNFNAEKFIFISTDKAVNPSSVMGATKRFGEMICQALNQKNSTKYASVRFGNVLDSRGSVIPIFKEQIRKNGPVEVTHPDMKRYFMTISEACLLVLQAGALSQGGEVFVLDMGKPIKILDLAREMIRLSGFEPDKDISIVFTKPRPGEKFFEEILTAEEGTIATQSKKIFKARLSNIASENDLEEYFKKLDKAAKENNKEEIKNILKTAVPFYTPHHIA